MKNHILYYIFKNPQIATFYGHGIIINFENNPVSACVLRALVEKHFNIVNTFIYPYCNDFTIEL